MNKQTLQLVGTVLLVAGLALGSIGTHRIVTNLPISDDEALAEARRSVLTDEEPAANRRGESLQGNVELQVWKSAIQHTNKARTEKRVEGAVFLVLGFIAFIWGMTIIYNSRSTPDEDER